MSRPIPPEPGDPVGAESGRHPEAVHLGRPEDELAVGGEGLGAVDELDDLRVGERRAREPSPPRRAARSGPSPAARRRLLKSAGMPVETPRRRVALVAARHEPSALAAEVDEQRRVAQRRHVAGQVRRLGDHVLVRHGHDGHVHAGQPADLVGVDAAGVDDDLALDPALVGLDAPHPAVGDVDRR